MTHDSIAAALSAFQAEMPTVAKSRQANAGSYKYTYAGLADVQAAAMPILTKHGLAFTCTPRQAEGGSFVLVGRLLHASGMLEGELPLFGRQAQELGSSITYARRYLLGALTGVVTDDDDDGHHAQGKKPAAPQPRDEQPAGPPRTAQRKPLPASTETGEIVTDAQLRRLGVAFSQAGITDRADRLMYVKETIGREVQSSKDLTKREASNVIDSFAASKPADVPEPDPWASASERYSEGGAK